MADTIQPLFSIKKELKGVLEEHDVAKKKTLEFNFPFNNASWQEMNHYLSATHIKPLSVHPCNLHLEAETDENEQKLATLELPCVKDDLTESNSHTDKENRVSSAKNGARDTESTSSKSNKSPPLPLRPQVSMSQMEAVVDKLADGLGFTKVTATTAFALTFKDGEIGIELVRGKSDGKLLESTLLSQARGRPVGDIDLLVAPAHTLGSISRLTQALCGISVKSPEEFVDNRERIQFEAALQCVALNQAQIVDDKVSVFVVVTDLAQYFEIVSLTTNELSERFVRFERFADIRFGLSAVRRMCVAAEEIVRGEIEKVETVTKKDVEKEDLERKRKRGVIENPFKFASGHRQSWIPEIIEEDDVLDLASLLGAQEESSEPPPNMFN